MTDAMTTAVVASASAIVGGILGGLLSGPYQHAREHLSRPKLAIDFEGSQANIDTAEYKDGESTVSEIYIRARIRNTGQRPARGCRVFIVGLTEVHASGTIPTSFHDAKQIAWAGYDFSPVDVPRGVNFYADVLRISKNRAGWLFSVRRLFASQMQLKDYRGTYRFRLMVTADNAEPVGCEIDVTYDGDWHSLRAIAARPV